MKKYLSLLILFILITAGFAQQKKDTATNRISCWQLNDIFTDIKILKLDSSINQFHVYDPVRKVSMLNCGLGNIGLATFPILYFDRFRSDFIFIESLYPYLFTAANNKYYNTRKPFTSVFYENGGTKKQKEQLLEILHTQNINKYLNAGVRYRLIHSLGQFALQESKNNHISLWLSYIRNRYSVHANFNYNLLKIFENGGIQNDSVFESGNYQSTSYIPVNLESAKSSVRAHSFVVSQSLTFGNTIADTSKKETFIPKSDLCYVFHFQRFSKSFYDDSPDISYYPDIFYDSTKTSDSVSLQTYENTLEWKIRTVQIKKINLKTGIRISNIFENIHDYRPDSLMNISENLNNFRQDTLLNVSWAGISAAMNLKPGINWTISGDYCIDGYKSGDYLIRSATGILPSTKDSATLSLLIELKKQTPSRFYQQYFSNHYLWNNNFQDMISRNVRVDLSIPEPYPTLTLQGISLSGFLYFNESGSPAQIRKNTTLFSASLSYVIHLKHFRSVTRMIYQASGSSSIRVPEFAWYNSFICQGYLIRNVLSAQFGIDVFYNSSFYSYSYVPATGIFCLQNEKKTGNYPYADVFINLKIRSIRLFAKFEHINSGWLNKDVYSLVHYPANSRTFKLGISWLFYN